VGPLNTEAVRLQYQGLSAIHSSAERFNYLYSEDELTGLAEPIRGLAAKAEQVHVLFKNNFTNYAQRNARQLQSPLRLLRN
jgi:uncharacterized protein YecE (DUF72 family)